MPVIFQKMILRDDLSANPDVIYLFGDNDRRSGNGGQAAEMRGEDNAVGIRTKWAPSNTPKSFFSDKDAEEIMGMIDEDLEPVQEHLENGGIVVIPYDGLGTGLAKLESKAPQVAEFLSESLEYLERIKPKSRR